MFFVEGALKDKLGVVENDDFRCFRPPYVRKHQRWG